MYLPAILCIASLTIIGWHQRKIKRLDKLPTIFSATTYDIGNDGGFTLEFKANGYVNAKKIDHFESTFYRGKYIQNRDSFHLSIPLDFQLGKTAIIKRDSLYIVGDTIKFFVLRPLVK